MTPEDIKRLCPEWFSAWKFRKPIPETEGYVLRQCIEALAQARQEIERLKAYREQFDGKPLRRYE